MKIHFDSSNFKFNWGDFTSLDPPGSGPTTFARRLIREFIDLGHEPEFDSGLKADISLVFIEPSGAHLAQTVVQRLDGIWFKPSEFATKNTRIKELYSTANSVVFQSHFDKKMATKWFSSPKNECVIHNGISINPLREIKHAALAELRSKYERIYVTSSNWHPQKRLRANVQLFNHLHQQNANSCLLVLGNNPDYLERNPNIFYTGPVAPEIYLEIYSIANWMIHLAWADHCPNVVIEALSQGTPVVCAEVGGTKELIGNYGCVLKEHPYEFELADYDNPPTIDVTQIKNLPDRSSLDYSSIVDIDIQNVAKKYISHFESLL